MVETFKCIRVKKGFLYIIIIYIVYILYVYIYIYQFHNSILYVFTRAIRARRGKGYIIKTNEVRNRLTCCKASASSTSMSKDPLELKDELVAPSAKGGQA